MSHSHCHAEIRFGVISGNGQGHCQRPLTSLTTIRKLTRTFAAHAIEFVADDPWTGVVMKVTADNRNKPWRNR